MLKVEITGNDAAIAVAKAQVVPLTDTGIREYEHKGADGEPGVFGIVTSIGVRALPKLLSILKPLLDRDRNLKISFNGLELIVRDLQEASAVISLLEARGLLIRKE